MIFLASSGNMTASGLREVFINDLGEMEFFNSEATDNGVAATDQASLTRSLEEHHYQVTCWEICLFTSGCLPLLSSLSWTHCSCCWGMDHIISSGISLGFPHLMVWLPPGFGSWIIYIMHIHIHKDDSEPECVEFCSGTKYCLLPREPIKQQSLVWTRSNRLTV